MIRLIASDLDGTLLNSLHTIDPTIARCIRATTDSGRHFVIATGRFMRDDMNFGFEGLPVEVVCSNGALVIGRDGQLLRKALLDKSFVEELLRNFPTLPFDFIGPRHIYTRLSAEQRVEKMRGPNLLMRVVMRGMAANLSGVCLTEQSEAQILNQDIVKVNCRVSDEGRKADLESFIAEHADLVVNAPFNPSMFEITAKGIDKGEAIAWLASKLGISATDVAVYGDGGNDIAMLSRFAPYGHAFATHGACKAAKLAASSSIGSNVFHAVPRHIQSVLQHEGSLE